MNYLLEVCLVALTLVTGITHSIGAEQSPVAAVENFSFAGIWEGRMNDLPAINLKIKEADRKTTGVIVFYFQERGDPDASWHIAGENAVPLLAPHVQNKTLMFEVRHQRCHGCSELGPNVKFRMELAGTNEARLWNLDEKTDSDPGLKLIRRAETTARVPQAKQNGISVELPVTSNAVPMPDADQEDSLLVSVTDDGSVYFGVNPISPTVLAEKVRDGLSNQKGKKLYIKADARTLYAHVLKVLDALRTAGVEAPILLTSQHDSSEPGTLVPPKGVDVLLGPPFPPGPEATVVQVLDSGQRWPTLKINDERTARAALQDTLQQLLQNPRKKVVSVKAEGALPYGDVVDIVDLCRSAGGMVILLAPRQ